MNINEMRDMTLQELEDKAREMAQDLFNLKIRQSLNQLDNPLQLRVARRDLARIKTLMSERRGQDSRESEG